MSALSRNRNPTPLGRMVDRAQRWASLLDWIGRDRELGQLHATDALVTPDEAASRNAHLMDPVPPGRP